MFCNWNFVKCQIFECDSTLSFKFTAIKHKCYIYCTVGFCWCEFRRTRNVFFLFWEFIICNLIDVIYFMIINCCCDIFLKGSAPCDQSIIDCNWCCILISIDRKISFFCLGINTCRYFIRAFFYIHIGSGFQFIKFLIRFNCTIRKWFNNFCLQNFACSLIHQFSF